MCVFKNSVYNECTEHFTFKKFLFCINNVSAAEIWNTATYSMIY